MSKENLKRFSQGSSANFIFLYLDIVTHSTLSRIDFYDLLLPNMLVSVYVEAEIETLRSTQNKHYGFHWVEWQVQVTWTMPLYEPASSDNDNRHHHQPTLLYIVFETANRCGFELEDV